MKLLNILLGSTVLAAGWPAMAQVTDVIFTFDTQPSGSAASLFHTADISFHNAMFAPETDEFGDPIPGSERWIIDTENDGFFPVLVQNPLEFDRGAAPSGINALNALDQPALIQFASPVDIFSFSVTLDNDSFGLVWNLDFVNGSTLIHSIEIDQSVPGLLVTANSLIGVSAIVLPSGAFYDDLTISYAPAVPEPSTWALFIGATGLAVAMIRRRRE
jgi:hypothetical protein